MSKKANKKNIPQQQRFLVLKTDDTEYGIVTKKLGSGRFSIRLNMQNREVIGRLCGKFRKGSQKTTNWVDIGTVVLVGLRDFQENIVDIIHVYEVSEIRQLKKSGDFVEETLRIDNENGSVDMPEDEIPFDFDEI